HTWDYMLWRTWHSESIWRALYATGRSYNLCAWPLSNGKIGCRIKIARPARKTTQ
ncbi:hypothetical protein FRC09_007249, partial [Ceratobasidium sp. 395]